MIDSIGGHSFLLNADEVRLLDRGLFGNAVDYSSPFLNALLGAGAALNSVVERERVRRCVERAPASLLPADISWLILKTELELVSDVLGTGVEWPMTMGIFDSDALTTLRGLRRKLVQAVRDESSCEGVFRVGDRYDTTRRFVEFYPPPRITRIFPDDPPKLLSLDPVEQTILRGGLGDFWAERDASAAAARVLFGDWDSTETLNRVRAVRAMIGPRTALTPAGWLRAQLCAELAFGSSLVGVPDRWADEVLPDALTLPALRGLQRKIIRLRPGLRLISHDPHIAL